MLFVGLTGGIGAGKSEALAASERLGAAVLSSDAVVHELLGTPEVENLLRERWGPGVVAEGEVDRAAVAEIVFQQPDELDWLERTIFPLVGQRIAAWRAQLEQAAERPEVAVVEVPLLFEARIEAVFDATIAVVTDEEVRVKRAGGRDHRAVEGRDARQLTQEQKAARADFVVRNDGSRADLQQGMAEVMAKLQGRESGT